MQNIKKIYKGMKPQIIKNAQGKPVEAFLDIKTYTAIMQTIAEWKKIQKKEGVGWVRVGPKKKSKLRT